MARDGKRWGGKASGRRGKVPVRPGVGAWLRLHYPGDPADLEGAFEEVPPADPLQQILDDLASNPANDN